MHSRIYRAFSLLLFAAAAGLLAVALAQRASAAVGLSAFTGTPVNGTVQLQWSTGFEDGTAGFRLRRDDIGNYISVLVNGSPNSFIPSASGGGGVGASYSVVDNAVTAGESYEYTLYEVPANGGADIELESITVDVPSAGIQVGGNPTTQTTTAAPTSTPVSQFTLVPTSTPLAPPTSAVVAQPTAFPTASPFTPTPAGGNATQPVDTTQNGSQPPSPVDTSETVGVNPQNEQEGPYPPPAALSEPQDEVAAGLQPTPTASALASGYAAPGEEVAAVNPNGATTIGGNTPLQTNPAAQVAPIQQSGESSTWLLWFGFIAAFIIFAAGVVGGILLFKRRQTEDF